MLWSKIALAGVTSSLLLLASAAYKIEYASSYNSYEVIEHTTFVEEIAGSTVSSFLGFFLFVGSLALLFWNEGRAVKTAESLSEAARLVVSTHENGVHLHENRLVHLSAFVRPVHEVSDDAFGVRLDALRLKRKVEVFQWQEVQTSHSQSNVGGGKTTHRHYDYRPTWSERIIDSRHFKMAAEHRNPSENELPFKTTCFNAQCAFGNSLKLPESLVNSLNNFEVLPLNQGIYSVLSPTLQGRFNLFNNALHTGDPMQPRVGDIRVVFETVKAGEYSVLARKSGPSFSEFTTSNGRAIFDIVPGHKSAVQMISSAAFSNNLISWAVRFGGWILNFIAILMILAPISAVFNIFPFIGHLLNLGTSGFAFVTSVALSFLVAAFAWLFHRPRVGVLLMAAACAIVYLSSSQANATYKQR